MSSPFSQPDAGFEFGEKDPQTVLFTPIVSKNSSEIAQAVQSVVDWAEQAISGRSGRVLLSALESALLEFDPSLFQLVTSLFFSATDVELTGDQLNLANSLLFCPSSHKPLPSMELSRIDLSVANPTHHIRMV